MSEITEMELAEIEVGLEGVTPGPWIRSGIQQKHLDQHGKYLAAGPDGALLFFSPLGTNGKSQAACIRDLDHIARMTPDTVRRIITRLRRAEATAPVAEGVREVLRWWVTQLREAGGNLVSIPTASGIGELSGTVGFGQARELANLIDAALAASPTPTSEPSRALVSRLVSQAKALLWALPYEQPGGVDQQRTDFAKRLGEVEVALSRAPTIPSSAPAVAGVSEVNLIWRWHKTPDEWAYAASAPDGGAPDLERVLVSPPSSAPARAEVSEDQIEEMAMDALGWSSLYRERREAGTHLVREARDLRVAVIAYRHALRAAHGVAEVSKK